MLTKFFLESVFLTGLIHTDLHPKNWGFRPDTEELIIYDFGAVLSLDSSIIATLKDLAGGKISSREAYVEAYSSLGFDPQAMKGLKDKLPELSDLFFAPIKNPVGYDFQAWKVKEKAEAVLGDMRWAFQERWASWFLMLMRSFTGWYYADKRIGSES